MLRTLNTVRSKALQVTQLIYDFSFALLLDRWRSLICYSNMNRLTILFYTESGTICISCLYIFRRSYGRAYKLRFKAPCFPTKILDGIDLGLVQVMLRAIKH